jgi:hypothetical protein
MKIVYVPSISAPLVEMVLIVDAIVVTLQERSISLSF